MGNSYDNVLKQRKEEEKRAKERESRGSGNIEDLFMKTPEGRHQVRLVGDVKTVFVYWGEHPNRKKYIVPESLVPKMKVLKFTVYKKLVSNVIDRKDQDDRVTDEKGPRFKILEKGNQVFGTIITRYEEVTDADGEPVDPGGPGGCDWAIKTTVPLDKDGKKDPRNTSYTNTNLENTPFSKEEIELIARTKNLSKIEGLVSEDLLKKLEKKNYWEKFEDLPIGERGLIDLDVFYNDEKDKEELIRIIEEEAGSNMEGAETKDEAAPKKEEDIDLDIDTDTDSDDIDLDKLLF